MLKRVYFFLISAGLFTSLHGQVLEDSLSSQGVSVSPSHIHFNVSPGKTRTQKIKVNNDTRQVNKFKVNLYDFNMNGRGKSTFLDPGTGKYSLSKHVSVSPTFVELQPGEVKEIAVTITLNAEDPAAYKAAWSILMVEQVQERTALDPGRGTGETIAMGVVPTFAFGVFMYQNPPQVEVNNVEIIDFKFDKGDAQDALKIAVQNEGDGVSYCTAYVELTNLNTGDQRKLLVKRFTIVPELIRDFDFVLPPDLPSGRYSAFAVLDFGSDDEIKGAELDFDKP